MLNSIGCSIHPYLPEMARPIFCVRAMISFQPVRILNIHDYGLIPAVYLQI